MSKIVSEKNKERCKRWREKLQQDQRKLQENKLKNQERMRINRQKWKALAEGNHEMIAAKRRYERIRKRLAREKLAAIRNAQQTQNEPYKWQQMFEKDLQKMPNDMEEILKVLEEQRKQNKHNSSRTLPESIVNSIKQFCMNDNVSVPTLEKKDTKLFEGAISAKRFMLMTVSEAYEMYIKRLPRESSRQIYFF